MQQSVRNAARRIAVLLVAAILAAAMAPTHAAAADAVETITPFTYQADGMALPRTLNGVMPAGDGQYPVFVYVTGTTMTPWSEDDQVITTQMARRGFVSVSVDWDTRPLYPFNCDTLTTSVGKLFDASDPDSAINRIGALPKADLARGIVVAGFSQGGNIASMARNFHPGVEAAYVIGHGYVFWGEACYAIEQTALPPSRIRSAFGAEDAVWPQGGTRDRNRVMLERTTGASCGSSATQCVSPDGSGWWLVSRTATADGQANHCFHYGNRGCDRVPFDAEFESGDAWWALPASLDWLAGFADDELPAPALAAAVLPSSRSALVGSQVTAFATVLNTGTAAATGCTLAQASSLPANFTFRRTDPATNAPVGEPDTPSDIAPGTGQTYVFGLTPLAPFASTVMEVAFSCANVPDAPIIAGVNTLRVTASEEPAPDVIALAATASGNGILTVAPDLGGAFSVATINVGAGGNLSVLCRHRDSVAAGSGQPVSDGPSVGRLYQPAITDR